MDLHGAVWCAVVNTRRSLKAAVVGVLFSGAIPLLAGLVVEKTIIAHLRTASDETPVVVLYQVRTARASLVAPTLLAVGHVLRAAAE